MLIFDLEANGLYQDATRIHCIAYHDSTIDETLSFNDEFPGKGMSNSITTAVMDLAQADYIVGHNIIGYDIPMLEARFVTTEQGTGIVHCAPSHGPDDFNLCLNNGIKAIETVDGDGKYTDKIPLFNGIHIFKANEIIISKLKEQKNLVANGKLNHQSRISKSGINSEIVVLNGNMFFIDRKNSSDRNGWGSQ